MVAANLRYHVLKAGAEVEGRVEVTQRLKRQDTLIGKLDRERGNVDDRPRARLHRQPEGRRLPRLHLVVRRAGFPIEVQVRTRGQDLWANAIEEAGRRTGVQFKFGEGPEKERTVFASVAALIADVEEGKLSTTQLLTAGLIGAAIMSLSKRQEREAR